MQEAVIVGAERVGIGHAVAIGEGDQKVIRLGPGRGDPPDRGVRAHPVGEDDAIYRAVVEEVVLDDHVLAVACCEQIGIAAVLALERIVAQIADQRVVSGATDQQIITVEAVDGIVGAEALDRVVPRGRAQGQQEIANVLCRQADVREVDKRDLRVDACAETVDRGDLVAIHKADDQIVGAASGWRDEREVRFGRDPVGEDDAVHRAIVEDVVLLDRIDPVAGREPVGVGTRAAKHGVVARAPIQDVVAADPDQKVVAGQSQ